MNEHLVWEVDVDFGAENYEACAADGTCYTIELEYGGAVKGHHAYALIYYPPGCGTDHPNTRILKEGVPTVAEARAIAQAHHDREATS